MEHQRLMIRKFLVGAAVICSFYAQAHAQSLFLDSLARHVSNPGDVNYEQKADSLEKNDASRPFDFTLPQLPFGFSNMFRTTDNAGLGSNGGLQTGDGYSQFPFDSSAVPFPVKQFTPGLIYHSEAFKIVGNVEVTNYPGIMVKQTGDLGFQYSRGNFSAYAGVFVNKYGFFGGLISQPGIGISAAYRLNGVMSLNTYGYWYGENNLPVFPSGLPMPPSMLGFYEVNRAGGYVNIAPSGHFGMHVGGQVVQRQGSVNHYEVEPIATPYVTVGNGKRKIGIGLPVGQILNGLLKK